MGSGVSKHPGRHSDSRVDEVRSELAKGANAAPRLNPEQFAHTLGGDQRQRKEKPRALSLPIGNGGSSWQKRGPSTSPIHPIGTLDEMHDELNGAVSSPEMPTINSADADVPSARRDTDRESDEFYEDDFEDDIVDWKKGDSIGSGSYGTVRMRLTLL